MKTVRVILLWVLPPLILAFLLASRFIDQLVEAQRLAGWTSHPAGQGWSLVNDLAVDVTGQVWLAGDGLAVSASGFAGSFQSVDLPPGFRHLGVSHIALDADQQPWIAADQSNQVSRWDGSRWTTHTLGDSADELNIVEAIAIGPDERVWVSILWHGVSVYDGTAWTTYTPDNSGLVDSRVTALGIDPHGRIWMGTFEDGISIFDGRTWQTLDESPHLGANEGISAIAFDLEGRAWIGHEWGHGLTTFYNGEWQHYTKANSVLPSDLVTTIQLDPAGRVWIGTLDGVTVVDGRDWTALTPDNSGLPNGWIREIAFDPHGQTLVVDTDGLISGLSLSSVAPVAAPVVTLRDRFLAPPASWIIAALLLLVWLAVGAYTQRRPATPPAGQGGSAAPPAAPAPAHRADRVIGHLAVWVFVSIAAWLLSAILPLFLFSTYNFVGGLSQLLSSLVPLLIIWSVPAALSGGMLRIMLRGLAPGRPWLLPSALLIAVLVGQSFFLRPDWVDGGATDAFQAFLFYAIAVLKSVAIGASAGLAAGLALAWLTQWTRKASE